MTRKAHRWVIVLAAGDGTRLQSLTARPVGGPIPKQFCSVGGTRSMLQHTLSRARLLVPPEKIVVVVAAQHRQWWQRELLDIPPGNVVVQPQNRGTGPGILLPLVLVQARDPEAEILLMPSDHYVDREDILCRAEEEAFLEATGPGRRIVLLGMTPQEADSGYGWILPTDSPPSRSCLTKVKGFVEKPPMREARDLMARGALINAFLLVGRCQSLLYLYREHPALVAAFRSLVSGPGGRSFESRALEKLYQKLTTLDFSESLLQSLPENLWVLPVPSCGWTDLGTPERVHTSLPLGERVRPRGTGGPRAVLDLATVAAHLFPPDLGGLSRNAAVARVTR